MQKTQFSNDEYYHIYNRGVDKRKIFSEEKDYLRFLTITREFNSTEVVGGLHMKYLKDKNKKENSDRGSASNLEAEPLSEFSSLVEIICYCLNQNHYHFVLKQLVENGISKFMHRLGTGHSAYFNKKYNRLGTLFQGKFKSIHINTNEYLLWLSGYVNGNVEIHKITKAENYKWCSYQDYLRSRNGTLCSKKIILSQFGNIEEYKKYVEMVIRESGNRKDMEKYFIEEEI